MRLNWLGNYGEKDLRGTPVSKTAFSVSVVIPAYNCSDSIERAIDSIRDQTIEVEEIIIVDDGSSDGTVDEIQRLALSRSFK